MRARNKIYHIDCFRCVACSRQLIPGDEFALRDDGLFCKADHDVVERAPTTSLTPTGSSPDDTNHSTFNNNNNEKKNGITPSGRVTFHYFIGVCLCVGLLTMGVDHVMSGRANFYDIYSGSVVTGAGLC